MIKKPEGWNEFLALCLETTDKKVFAMLADLFFTPEEREDFGKRFLIIKEMVRGEKTQREIAKELGVSVAKITRGSNELKRMDPKLIKYLESLWQ